MKFTGTSTMLSRAKENLFGSKHLCGMLSLIPVSKIGKCFTPTMQTSAKSFVRGNDQKKMPSNARCDDVETISQLRQRLHLICPGQLL